MTQAKLGTALFASGAINTWRVETIADVLLRHDTMHKGDDVQQGLILHCLAHKTYFLQPELRHPGNYKVRPPFFFFGCTCAFESAPHALLDMRVPSPRSTSRPR